MGSFIKKIQNILKTSKAIFPVVLCVIFIVSFSCCFVSGAINPSVKVEETAEYVAEIAQNHTKNKKYASLLVEPNDKTDKKLIDSGLELYSLYGVFRENIASFASVVNADHAHNVKFKDIETEDLSYLYVTSGFNTVEYHGHYKHEYYPLEVMFNRNGDPEIWGKKNFASLIYLSQSQANKFLDLENLEHTEQNYKTLIKKRICMNIDGVEKEWQIEDIYYETNYFYDAVRECAGEFVFAFSADGFSGMKKQSMYFLSAYTFRNSFYFDYATNLYPTDAFTYRINNLNFIDDYKVDESKLVFSIDSKEAVGSYLVLFFGILMLVIGLALIFIAPLKIKWWHHVVFSLSSLSPYLLFKLLYILTKRVIIFSTFATNANIIMLIAAIVGYVAVILFRRKIPYEVKD